MTASSPTGSLPVRLDGVTVRHGATTAVDDVTLVVEPGEVVALLGPNGAGKTTLLETVQGYLTPASGTVRVFGMDPSGAASELAHRWGVMPQAGGLPMGLTVRECVALFTTLHGSSADADELISLTGLADLARRKWRRLSGGEQQRLSLALALCGGSDLLMLDEPTAAVDDAGRTQILDLIASRARAGAAVIVTTHRFDDVEHVASRVVMLHHGSIVADDSLDALTADADHIRFTAPAGLDIVNLATLVGPTTEISAGRYEVAVPPEPETVGTVVSWLTEQGIAPEAVQAGRTSIEARYRELTEGDS